MVVVVTGVVVVVVTGVVVVVVTGVVVVVVTGVVVVVVTGVVSGCGCWPCRSNRDCFSGQRDTITLSVRVSVC